nr:septum formation initiator family protein [uncultured Porphyromonas sp.]
MMGKKLGSRVAARTRDFLKRIDRYNAAHPWVLALACFVLLSVTELAFGEASVFEQIEHRATISRLKHSVRDAKRKFEQDSLALQQLNGREELERIARIKYNFEKPGEVTFLIVDTTSHQD